MKPRTILLILLALVCGISAAVGVNQLNGTEAPVTEGDTVPVVLASQDIPRGGVLTSENCVIRQRPKADLPTGAITDMEAAIGRTVVVPIFKDEAVLEVKISGKESGRGLAAMIDPGMRAVTIQTPHVAAGVGGLIMPGDKVDVLLTSRSEKRNGPSDRATATLLQNVQVLAVDRRLGDPEDDDQPDMKDPRSITLMVTPDQANKLDLGMHAGELHLSLRNPEDEGKIVTRPATLEDRYRTASIRTLRGSSRGHIRIDTAP